jgi:hypothetical protein
MASPARKTNRLLRCAVAAGCLLALAGCVVYPAGGYGYGYGPPHPVYYGGGYGYYGRPGWR